MSENANIIATFFGDAEYPVEWKDEAEKSLMWWYDDLHCPNPISPLYFDIGGWWGITCEYMYRRFGAPFGKYWLAKKIGGYVYSAIVPHPPETDFASLGAYWGVEMPIYADKFLGWWKNRYIPEITANHKYMDDFDRAGATIPEYLIHLEDCLDIQERHFKIHWILNLAQFAAGLDFRAAYTEALGEIDEENLGRIIVSDNDRNWDSLRALWEIKEFIKTAPSLVELIGKPTDEIKATIATVEKGGELLKKIEEYQDEYGYKAVYTHEYIFTTWKEDPAPIYDALRIYVADDYDFNIAFNKCKEDQTAAINELYARAAGSPVIDKLKTTLELAVRMAPLTPDHHFYIDQGCYSRVRIMFVELGRKMAAAGILDDAEDIFMLEYEEIRAICVRPDAFDCKARVAERRAAMVMAGKKAPREWYGTIDHWQMYEEPYKSLWGWPFKYETELAAKAQQQSATVIKGIPASPGIVEGIARCVASPAEFDQIQMGDILICKMTNPAWVVSFSKISGLVTDTGAALSHPGVVSREFGIPCVVGTSKATRMISSGMKVRVDGSKGIVEILE